MRRISCPSCLFPRGWRSHRPPPRRRQNSYRAPDVAAAVLPQRPMLPQLFAPDLGGRLGDRRFSAGGGSESPSSTHRSALLPLHALIGSASTTISRGTAQASCTRAPIGADASGGWRSHRPPRRRRQNSYRLNSSDAARSRRAHSGGPTRRSEIFSGRAVGFSSSTHRSHQKPLHVLIGSPLTIYEGGAVARTGSGGATGMRNAMLAYPHGRRRQQFSPASV